MIKARLYTFDLKHAYCIKSVILTLITIEELSYLPEKGTICHILNVLKCYSGHSQEKIYRSKQHMIFVRMNFILKIHIQTQ